MNNNTLPLPDEPGPIDNEGAAHDFDFDFDFIHDSQPLEPADIYSIGWLDWLGVSRVLAAPHEYEARQELKRQQWLAYGWTTVDYNWDVPF